MQAISTKGPQTTSPLLSPITPNSEYLSTCVFQTAASVEKKGGKIRVRKQGKIIIAQPDDLILLKLQLSMAFETLDLKT